MELLPTRMRGRGTDLGALLDRLGERGLHSVLVEGGGALAASLLRSELVDELVWFTAPRIIGGDGRSMIGPLGTLKMSQAIELRDMSVSPVGADLLHRAIPARA